MATVCHPASGRITASFAAVAKHYGVSVAICPARRGNRKGVVEKANHTAAQRWWRTLPDDTTPEQAQACLDRWCLLRGDTRHAPHRRRKATVATVAARRAADPGAGAVPGRPGRRAGRQRAGAGRLPRQPLLGATRAGPRPGHGDPPARRAPHRAGHQPAGSSSPATSSRRPGPAPPSATPDTSWHWNAPPWPRSPPPRRTAASSASHPAPPPGPPRPALRASGSGTPTVHTRHVRRAPQPARSVPRSWSAHAAAAQGRNTLRWPTPSQHDHDRAEQAPPGQPLPATTRPPGGAQAAHRRRQLSVVLDRAAAEKAVADRALGQCFLALESPARLAGRLRFA